MPDLSDLADDLLHNAATEGVQSYTADGESVTAYPLKDILALVNKSATVDATAQGRSGWGRLRTARAIPPGGGPE